MFAKQLHARFPEQVEKKETSLSRIEFSIGVEPKWREARRCEPRRREPVCIVHMDENKLVGEGREREADEIVG